MKAFVISESSNGLDIKGEIRRLKVATKKATSSRKAAVRFLASTGMYTASGKLKPRFR
jgi:hypothetical protein